MTFRTRGMTMMRTVILVHLMALRSIQMLSHVVPVTRHDRQQ